MCVVTTLAGTMAAIEREAIGRRGDVAICQPRPRKITGREQSRRPGGGDESAGSGDVDSEGLHLFTFDDRTEASPAVRDEMRAVVGRVQLAAETRSPAVVVRKRVELEGDARHDRGVETGPDIRNG